ncbi:MAG: hypothetical protein AAB696_00470, partial [Patescibacteria group bacterium]
MAKESLKSFEDLGKFKDQFPSVEKKPQDLGAAAKKEIEKAEQDAEDLVKAVLGEDVFEKFDKELEIPKPQSLGAAVAKEKKIVESGDVKFKYKGAIDKQIKELGDKLKTAEKDADRVERNNGTKKQIEEYQKRVDFFEKEIEKAKEAGDKIKSKTQEKQEKKIKTKNPSSQLEQVKIKNPVKEIPISDNWTTPDKYQKSDEEIEKVTNRIKEKKDENDKGVEKEWDLGRVEKDENPEKWFNEEAIKVETEIEKMPDAEREKISLGLRNFDFFTQEGKSRNMAQICEKFVSEKGSIGRFFSAMAETYRKNEDSAKKRSEQGSLVGGFQNKSLLIGNIMKYGRTVADVIGWTAGSPLRYVMLGAQFFS